jgi:hypothetical protein
LESQFALWANLTSAVLNGVIHLLTALIVVRSWLFFNSYIDLLVIKVLISEAKHPLSPLKSRGLNLIKRQIGGIKRQIGGSYSH